MPKELSPAKPNTRRYTPEEKAQAVRLVRQLRRELGTSHGTIQRVAEQLGYGTESVRSWVRQADIDDGEASGVTTVDAERMRQSSRRTGSFDGPMRSCAGHRLSSRLCEAEGAWRGSLVSSLPS